MVKRPFTALGTARTFLTLGACSESTLHVLDRAYATVRRPEERATMSLAGGIMQHGFQCGAVWGSAMGAGSRAHQLLGPGRRAEAAAIRVTQRLVAGFQERHGSVDCGDITDMDMKSASSRELSIFFFVKGGFFRCMHLVSTWATRAYDAIEEGMEDLPEEEPECEVSCAAAMVRMLGGTEEQACMAAGLAGGVGLCGGGCGALAVATWLEGMRLGQERGGELGPIWEDEEFTARFEELVARFLEATDYEFECREITGRSFADVDEHAAWLAQGGCARVLAALAAVASPSADEAA